MGILDGRAAVVTGALFAVRRAVRLAPAVAMAPPPPTLYRPTVVERFAEAGSFGPPTRMILRHVTRWPLRSLATMSGIAASVAILVMSLFFLDSIEEMLDSFFFRSQHQDVTVQFTEIRDDVTRYEIDGLPGVLQTELYRVVIDDKKHVHTEILLKDLARIRDVETGPDGLVYLLLEHEAGSQIVRLVPEPQALARAP